MLRVHQASGLAFGAGHLIDILRGQAGPKVLQHGHERLSTFGIGADLSETQWRSVLRQLVAIDAVQVSPGEFRTLEPGPAARAVLRGETSVVLRAARGGRSRPTSKSPQTSKPEDAALDAPAQTRLAALKHWRADVARAHQLPAFVIFHDSTLRALAVQAPQSLEGLSHISGIGQRKLEAYGQDLLAVIASQTTEGLA
jgi:ATP-dependent DNA helicase RecQ